MGNHNKLTFLKHPLCFRSSSTLTYHWLIAGWIYNLNNEGAAKLSCDDNKAGCVELLIVAPVLMFLVNFGQDHFPLSTSFLVGMTGSCLDEEFSMTSEIL